MPFSVFYLDDEKELCDNFVDFFGSDLVVVTAFTDAQTAIISAKFLAPDMFFIDYRLPTMTGEEVAEALPRSIPKYLITGDISVEARYPFHAIFHKPYNVEEIQRLIDKQRLAKTNP